MLNELFGEQALLTYPSDRPGMQYGKIRIVKA